MPVLVGCMTANVSETVVWSSSSLDELALDELALAELACIDLAGSRMRAATAKIKKDVATGFDYTRWGVWSLGILVAIARHI